MPDREREIRDIVLEASKKLEGILAGEKETVEAEQPRRKRPRQELEILDLDPPQPALGSTSPSRELLSQREVHPTNPSLLDPTGEESAIL
ncbi:hypothetical protein BJ508DRAFT_335461 [Ascobolus immersus RN42]|uniref:Uncharacterized protein n=1 Tax=Ascobolus immersus RN42 TaxID=1160509 RepID=A0A3N4HQS3_ASCIM|nr:hypothetical protein BJ508DRAFT_335461 [Ascobolus immersus RN42]